MTELKLLPKKSYSGCDFYQLAKLENVRFKIEFGPKTMAKLRTFLLTHPDVDQLRIHYDMNYTADLTRGSYAYGNELQFKAWEDSPNCRVECRVEWQNGYDRVEMNLPESEGISFLTNSLMGYQRVTRQLKRK